MASTLQRTSQARLWLIENRAGPNNSPEYLGRARAGSFDWSLGDRTPIYTPSEDAYGEFDVVDIVEGQPDLPGLTVEALLERGRSTLLALARKRCEADVQLHIGACKDPTDFEKGWEVIRVLEGAKPTNYGTDDQMALSPDQDAVPLENSTFTGRDYYEILPIVPAQRAASAITDAVVDVVIVDKKSCGECGIESDGCQVGFAIIGPTAGSPGLPSEVIYTQDGWATAGETFIGSLSTSEEPNAAAGVGTYLVVVSNDSGSLHYAPVADILNGVETWTEVSTGFNASGDPNAIFSLGRTRTWIVGDGGYIYFSDDITAGVSTQTAGDVTVENLAAIHGLNKDNLVAVGANNAVLATQNGGVTWSAITGPANGVALTSVWMRTASEWFVGAANGRLYYTRDSGQTWVEKAFSGAGAGSVTDISFSTPTVGYMSHNTASPAGRIFRTVDGGFSWYALPENDGLIFPENDGINTIAACKDNPNLVWGGGLNANGSDGILVTAS